MQRSIFFLLVFLIGQVAFTQSARMHRKSSVFVEDSILSFPISEEDQRLWLLIFESIERDDGLFLEMMQEDGREKDLLYINFNNDYSFLHHACAWGRDDVVKYLLAKKVPKVDLLTTDTQASPLHMAAYWGCLSSVKLLWEAGARSTLDASHHSPRDYAVVNGHTEIIEFFNEKEKTEKDGAKICSICLEKPSDAVFECGHGGCEICLKTIVAGSRTRKCHICRKPSLKYIKLFL